MATYKLKPIIAVEARGVITPDFKGPIITGDGPDDYVCPNCDTVLAKSVTLSDLTRLNNAALKCYNCSKVSYL